jgi:hypothetical protein
VEVLDAGGTSKSSSRWRDFELCSYAQRETVACIGAVRDKGLAPGVVPPDGHYNAILVYCDCSRCSSRKRRGAGIVGVSTDRGLGEIEVIRKNVNCTLSKISYSLPF